VNTRCFDAAATPGGGGSRPLARPWTAGHQGTRSQTRKCDSDRNSRSHSARAEPIAREERALASELKGFGSALEDRAAARCSVSTEDDSPDRFRVSSARPRAVTAEERRNRPVRFRSAISARESRTAIRLTRRRLPARSVRPCGKPPLRPQCPRSKTQPRDAEPRKPARLDHDRNPSDATPSESRQNARTRRTAAA
jgi:hypothetical protein